MSKEQGKYLAALILVAMLTLPFFLASTNWKIAAIAGQVLIVALAWHRWAPKP